MYACAKFVSTPALVSVHFSRVPSGNMTVAVLMSLLNQVGLYVNLTVANRQGYLQARPITCQANVK